VTISDCVTTKLQCPVLETSFCLVPSIVVEGPSFVLPEPEEGGGRFLAPRSFPAGGRFFCLSLLFTKSVTSSDQPFSAKSCIARASTVNRINQLVTTKRHCQKGRQNRFLNLVCFDYAEKTKPWKKRSSRFCSFSSRSIKVTEVWCTESDKNQDVISGEWWRFRR